jgi:hypothetical protein
MFHGDPYNIQLQLCLPSKKFIVFNNNISVISWRSVLLVEETGVPGENHRPVGSHWQTLSHNDIVESGVKHHNLNTNPQYCICFHDFRTFFPSKCVNNCTFNVNFQFNCVLLFPGLTFSHMFKKVVGSCKSNYQTTTTGPEAIEASWIKNHLHHISYLPWYCWTMLT